MEKKYYLAIDIGASSGRHILGWKENGEIKTEEIFRFENSVEEKNGHLCWNIERLFQNVVEGIGKCGEKGVVPQSIGIDTWGVDFVLLDKDGNRIGDAVSYRDNRTSGMDKEVEKFVSPEELYARTGIQKQIFNTIYQLSSIKKFSPEVLENAEDFLMIPDYLNYLLTGVRKNEYTNATTTNLVDVKTNQFDLELIGRIELPTKLFSRKLSMPGEVVGLLKKEIAEKVGFTTSVVLPATHDTGSAFLSVPAKDESSVYISSGTWSLLGVELKSAVTSKESMAANFTNEGGYQYRYRYLKNIMGLWVIQNCRKSFGSKYSFADLEMLARESTLSSDVIIDINLSRFLAPKDMVSEIVDECKKVHNIELNDVGDIMKCVYLSLADCYAKAVKELSSLTGTEYTSMNIVGGGSRDKFLNELTSKATGLPVHAGPTEGTALGNLIAQMILGKEFSDLAEARQAVFMD